MYKVNKDFIIEKIGTLKYRIGEIKTELNQLQIDIAKFTKDLESENK